jgi:hypothetical protein
LNKLFIASAAAVMLALAPAVSSSAINLTVGSDTWDINEDYFGVNEFGSNDAYDASTLGLSIDGGDDFETYGCRTDDLVTETVIGSGKIATCNELVTLVAGLNVRGFAYVYPDGVNVAVTYKVTNTTGSAISFNWASYHDFGSGYRDAATFSSVYSKGDGSEYDSAPATVAWGPTNQDCSAASDENDGYDEMTVESESCSLAAGASIGITIFHMVDDNESNSDLTTAATGRFVTRNADTTLRAGIPSGLVSTNWGLTGTLDVSGVPAAADPYDGTSMTLTGNAVLGNDMTVAFKTGVTPVGDYYDVWMCPNKDVMPIDEVTEGECVAVTFWNRAVVAGYNQATTAKTMTWELSNESAPGRISAGGANYLDGSGEPIYMDPPTEDGGWCVYEGWYMIVQDYIADVEQPQVGAHSNWSPAIGAAGCSEPAGSGNGDDEGLATTGADGQQAGLIGVFGLLALLAALGVRINLRRGVGSL